MPDAPDDSTEPFPSPTGPEEHFLALREVEGLSALHWARAAPLLMDHIAWRDLLFLVTVYRRITTVPGAVIELGVHTGKNLAALVNLRSVFEPANATRAIFGFDTFSGFPPDAPLEDSPLATPGRFAMPPGYSSALRKLLRDHAELGSLHADADAGVDLVIGPVAETVPRFIDEHPELVIALVYFDLDLYHPTAFCLERLLPYLAPGAVIAFDEFARPQWPGEARAFRELLGGSSGKLRLVRPSFATKQAFVVWS